MAKANYCRCLHQLYSIIMNCLLEAVLNIWRVMFPCMPVVFPRLAPFQHLPFYWKTRRSHEKWSEPFFKNHQPNPGIRGVLSVRFLQLSLLEGGCADASFTTYKPSFGSSLAFILGWLQHQVMARDGWIRKKHPCCPNHCLIKPETMSI